MVRTMLTTSNSWGPAIGTEYTFNGRKAHYAVL